MPLTVLSVDEIVATLRNTALPTILVEGRDDMTAYRWIEDKLGAQTANILSCGSRDNLFAVFARRVEFSHLKCAFLADRDMWLFDSQCSKFGDVVFTSGYSIENDLLTGSHVHDLLSHNERDTFDAIAGCLAEWFAFEVQEYRSGRSYMIDVHPNRVVPLGGSDLDPAFLALRGYRKPTASLVRSIAGHFTVRFRGKCLLDLYVRILSSPNRRSKFSKHNLLEIGAKCDCRVHMDRLIRLIEKRLK